MERERQKFYVKISTKQQAFQQTVALRANAVAVGCGRPKVVLAAMSVVRVVGCVNLVVVVVVVWLLNFSNA